MRRGHTRGGLLYPVIYTDLEKAIKELGTEQVLTMVNSYLRNRGMTRKRLQLKRTQQQAAAVSEERS